ncbi:MAG: NADH-quinone oxidoreductase subunit H, partial [Actinobacteria bacterium]
LTIMPIGLILAGWASNNKYSLIGGLRAAAQQISYEIPLLLAALGVIMVAGSLNMIELVEKQSGFLLSIGGIGIIPQWFIFFQPFGFVLFFIAVLADLNRSPFDLPEAESEIIAGPFTEYSSMKFIIFLFAEYATLIVLSGVIVIMYLGGWNGPSFLPPVIWFFLKLYFVIWFGIWIKGTVPRLRIDQLMNLGWKVLLPLAFLNITVTGLFILQAGL